jgi:hypothetical protein
MINLKFCPNCYAVYTSEAYICRHACCEHGMASEPQNLKDFQLSFKESKVAKKDLENTNE